MHLSPDGTNPRTEYAGFLPKELHVLWKKSCHSTTFVSGWGCGTLCSGWGLPGTLWDCCTGTEPATSAEWEWALPSSELTVRDLFSCAFIQDCWSVVGPLFWLLRDPTAQVHGNMINGYLAYASCYISPPHSAWADRLWFPSPVCCPLNSSGYQFFNYVFPQILRITFSL